MLGVFRTLQPIDLREGITSRSILKIIKAANQILDYLIITTMRK